MSLRVEDSRKLLVKIVGTEPYITNQGFAQKMRAFLMTRIKTHLSSYIKSEKLNIFEIDEHLTKMSEALFDIFTPDFMDYGVSMERFFVTTIVKPEDEPNYKRFKDLHFRQYADIAEAKLRQQTGIIDQETEKAKTIIEAEATATRRAVEGYTYQQERQFDVAQSMASNEAVGGMANMGVGLGMMGAVGGTVAPVVGGMMQNAMSGMAGTGNPSAPIAQPTANPCTNCGKTLIVGSKFCLECGTPTLADNEMICPSCSVKTIKGKFCLECGASMIKKCGNCETEIPTGGKFCPECGTVI
jgi:membrane protease subunit (stomatin/prohibitin family)